MDITAGLAKLKTQINKLERRIHNLDMDKVEASELHSAIESLNALKDRYKEMKDEHTKKKQEKESKTIKMDTKELVKEHEQLVDVLKSPSHADDKEEAKKQEKELNEYKESALACPKCGKSDSVTPASGYKLNKCDACHYAFDNESSPSYVEPEEKEAATGNPHGFDPKDENVPCQQCKRTDEPLHTDYKCPNCSSVPDRTADATKFPSLPPRKMPKHHVVEREEVWPEPSDESPKFPSRPPRKMMKHRIVDVPTPQAKKSDVEKYAIHDVVEPARGTPGSKGRVMGHDEANDMVYVAWHEGKLKDSHGYGAYSTKDLKKSASQIEAMPSYIIEDDHHGEQVFWNNEMGWVDDKTLATKFSAAETKQVNLPVGNDVGWIQSSLTKVAESCSVDGCTSKVEETIKGKPYCYKHMWGVDPKKKASLVKKAGPGAGREFEVKKNEVTGGSFIYNMETGKITWKQMPEIIAFDLHGYYDGMNDINGNLVKITDVAAGWWEGGQANIKTDLAGIIKQWQAEAPQEWEGKTGDINIGVDFYGLKAMLGGGYMRTTYKPGDTFQACGSGYLESDYLYEIDLCATIQWQEGTTEFEQDVFENTSPAEREDGEPLEDYDYQDHYEMQTEPYHAPRKPKSSQESDVTKEADDEINDHDMDDSGESMDDEPTEDDIFIQDVGHLGSGTAAFQGNKQIAKLDNSADDPWQEFYSAISDWMDKNNFFPTVWSVSDHGNHHLAESFYEFTKERNTEKEQPALETVSAIPETDWKIEGLYERTWEEVFAGKKSECRENLRLYRENEPSTAFRMVRDRSGQNVEAGAYESQSPVEELAESFINGNISYVRKQLARRPKLKREISEWMQEFAPRESESFDRLMGLPSRQQMMEDMYTEGSLNKSATVTKHKDGWHVMSEEGKNLGGPYKSKEQAVKRLRQVEYFKHHKAALSKEATSWNVLENGDLEITLSPEEAKHFDINPEALDSDDAMYDLLEPVVANGLSFVAPEDIGALTDAPILSDSPPLDDGSANPEANYWWFPDYMVKSPARELVETGKVIFKKASLTKVIADNNKIPLNVFDGGFYAIETSGTNVEAPHGYAIFNPAGQQVMVITTKQPITPERLESIVHDEYGKKELVRATLKENHEALKVGSKFTVSGIDRVTKEVRIKANNSHVWVPISKVAVSAENIEQQISDMKTKMTNTQERLQQVVTTNATVDATSGKFQEGDRVTDPRKGEGTVVKVWSGPMGGQMVPMITVDWDWIGQKMLGPEPLTPGKQKGLKKIDKAPEVQPEVQASVEKAATDPRPNTIPPPGMRWVLDEDTQPAMWVLVKKEGL